MKVDLQLQCTSRFRQGEGQAKWKCGHASVNHIGLADSDARLN